MQTMHILKTTTGHPVKLIAVTTWATFDLNGNRHEYDTYRDGARPLFIHCEVTYPDGETKFKHLAVGEIFGLGLFDALHQFVDAARQEVTA